jgi:gamma-glutamyltranspeptidase/glutathione hydrolase
VFSPRAPCGGWTVIQALQVLDRTEPLSLHAMAEALQLAFGDRYRLAGDGQDVDALLSASRTEELARTIRPDGKSRITRSLPASPWMDPDVDVGHGTTHLCAIDGAGRTVSCTLTAGNTFGAKVMTNGVLFDSGMAWFDPRPGAPNSIAPGKRPLVNMAPLLLVRGGDRVALGAAGGRRIISAVTQAAGGIIDHGLAPEEAVSAPRLDASDRRIRVSDRFPADAVARLTGLGHEVLEVSEERLPFSYEFARLAVAAVDGAGLRSGASS